MAWKKSPLPMAAKFDSLPGRVEAGLAPIAAENAQDGERSMKNNAFWNDRSEKARGDLFGESEGKKITLGTHNEEYGFFLEGGTVKMMAYPIIEPTMFEQGVEYAADAEELVLRELAG